MTIRELCQRVHAAQAELRRHGVWGNESLIVKLNPLDLEELRREWLDTTSFRGEYNLVEASDRPYAMFDRVLGIPIRSSLMHKKGVIKVQLEVDA